MFSLSFISQSFFFFYQQGNILNVISLVVLEEKNDTWDASHLPTHHEI